VTSLRLEAPAKLNLGLRVVGRRADGYHLLESLFVPVSLADRIDLHFEARGPAAVELELEGSASALPRDASNLAVAAARAFFRTSPPGGRLRIVLEKRIPTAAGLGGGSSDAATVLRGLARLASSVPSPEDLARLACGLGADVPFFLDPRPAIVRGIGDEIEPVGGVPPLWVVLLNPGVRVPTAEVFRLYDALGSELPEEGADASAPAPSSLTPSDPGSTLRALSGLGGNPDALARLPWFSNDLEAAATRLCPPIARLRDRICELGAVVAGMSGSGGTVYGLFGRQGEAQEAVEKAGFEAPTWSRVARLLV